MKKLQFCLVLLSLLALAVSAFAQVQNSQVQGTVSDPSGAAIPGAKVTVVNLGTNLSITVTSNQSGDYVAKELPVGSYTVTAEAPGFKTITNTNLTMNAGTIQHVDFKMQLGQAKEVVEVSGEAAQISVEDSKLANIVNSTQIANLPLNGRNVYDLIKLTPGAVDTRSTDEENDGSPGGAGTVVNGIRQDFNGFTINGVSNKALSGGAVNQPIEDTVQEFQQLSLNMSAQYGNSAGSITNLVTKSGTNDFHGSAFGFLRNDYFDATNFFIGQAGEKNPPLRYDQFGGTFGGPIIKDKLFFLVAYQHDHFLTSNTPSSVFAETPQWRSAVAAANPDSVAALLYNNFLPSVPVSGGGQTLTQYLSTNGASGNIGDYLCPTSSFYTGGGLTLTPQALAQSEAAANRIGNIVGVTAADLAGCSDPIALRSAVAGFSRDSTPIQGQTISLFKSQQEGNLFQGDEGSVRLDYNPSDKNRFFIQAGWLQRQDTYGPGLPQSARGFSNPTQAKYPNFQFSFVHTFSPTILNEFRAGYLLNTLLQRANTPGVPDINFDDGTLGFGSYNGYPQFFKENVYTYSDMVSVTHGNHNMKIGADIRRNIENSEFDVSRPSYYFNDQLIFAGDLPYAEAAGVDPGLCSGPPCTTLNANPTSRLSTNDRHFRNIEAGLYFQDDWKVNKRLTLNLGLRYDLFTRHNELNNLATTFLQGPGSSLITNISTGAGWLQQANAPLGTAGCPFTPFNVAASTVAGVCGPGGFSPSSSLGKGDHNDFGPRFGFAWDVFGDGKTSLRGGYGLSYEGTLYNPLSNSRWDPPYYSFNNAQNFLTGQPNGVVIYGPQTPGDAPRYTGAPDPANFQGPGANSVGNLQGWYPFNQNLANLTGIILPQGIRDPYVHNFFLSTQRELFSKAVLELDYVGTAGHKLFRAQDINRIPGGLLPEGTCTQDNFGRTLCSQLNGTDRGDGNAINSTGRLNPNFGTLRNWQNVVNSNYDSLQASLKLQAIHGVTGNISYTWSHSIDEGSTWHSGATTANGNAAGEQYSLDQTLPQLDRGNSIYDIRHRLVVNYVWDLPFGNHLSNSFAKAILGGWQLNGIWSFQTGAHWSPFCRSFANPDVNSSGQVTNTGCDFNLDTDRNDRPNSTVSNISTTHDQWAYGYCGTFGCDATASQYTLSGDSTPGSGSTIFTRPCAGCVGTLGRNTFVGPMFFDTDASLFKNIKATERVSVQLRWEVFNVFNHTNFQLPGANSSTHNRVNDSAFGQAGGAFDPRVQQFGLKVQF